MAPALRRLLFITGATRGIGLYLAEQAVRAGFDVAGFARSVEGEFPFPVFACDVSDARSVKSAFRLALQHYSSNADGSGQNCDPNCAQPDKQGRDAACGSHKAPWALINAAGVAAMNLVLTMPPASMEKLVRTNLLGTMYCCAEAGRLMARQKSGRIINFSSISVPVGLEGEAAYAASKAGVECFSRIFAKEMGGLGVTANTIAPGPVQTGLIAGVAPESIAALIQRQSIKKQGVPADIWDIVSLLLDERSSMITGDVFHVGGV